jgi:DNA-directed RNA polymerase specialized sigma24 family protein
MYPSSDGYARTLALAPISTASELEQTTQLGSDQRALFDGIRSGDERVASEVASQLLPVVHATLDRLLGTASAPHDDCARRSLEQIILEISRHPHPWVCRLEVWASALTARVALTLLRPRSSLRSLHGATPRRGGKADSSRPHPSLEPRLDSERQLARRAGIERLRTLLAELPPAQAEVIVMHDVLGLAKSQIAATLRISLEALTSRLASGHERLAARMATGVETVAYASTRTVAAAQ